MLDLARQSQMYFLEFDLDGHRQSATRPLRRASRTNVLPIRDRQDRAKLLPAVPQRYRALVGLAGGTGLRWGECAGLRWDVVDLAARTLRVVRVAVEVSGHVTDKAYPKSRAGRRIVPLPGFVVDLLTEH